MLDEVFEELVLGFEGVAVALARDLTKIRTGRANPAIFDGIRVDYYGTPTPLNQVGSIKVSDATLLTIAPWEKPMIPIIEKAILTSDLGLNPTNDGTIVRVPIPPLTGERRRDLVKLVKKAGEEHKIACRGHRREANETVKLLQKDGEISEDEMHRALKTVQDHTDKAVGKVESAITAKEKEILEV
jgi:ribosome recycling factor